MAEARKRDGSAKLWTQCISTLKLSSEPLCAGTLEIPALFAVHESAPDDPSIPLQQAYPQPTDPQSGIPTGNMTPPFRETKGQSGKEKATAASHKDHDAGQGQQDKPMVNSSPDPKDADNGASGSNVRSGITWKPKSLRLKGLRQAQQKEAQKVAESVPLDSLFTTEQREAGSFALPCSWYTEQLFDDDLNAANADAPSSLVEQVIQEKQQQQLRVQAAADQQGKGHQGTSSLGASAQAKESPGDSNPIAKPGAQRLAGSESDAALQTEASVFLPRLDLLAQFDDAGSQVEDASDHDVAGDTDATEASAASCSSDSKDTTAASSDQGLADENSNMVVNLNGAQVLTPDGWQPVTNKSEAGTAWEQGNCLTLGMTLQYQMCAESRKIVAVTCGWATIDAYAFEIQDMLDMYIKCTGLHDL